MDLNSYRNYALSVKYVCWSFSCKTFSSFIVNINVRTVLFWAVTQRVVVIPYVFGQLGQGSKGFLTLEDGTDRLSRNISKELITTHCIIARKSAVLIYFTAEA
jgi:hypothetical protein